MASAGVQLQISDSYLQQFNLSIGVSGMLKLQQFPFLQQLGYNGQIGYMKNDFHGLKDHYQQMAKYSSTHYILRAAWAVIISMVMGNSQILQLLFSAPSLGTVGKLFQSLHNFGAVFSLSAQDLTNPSTVASLVNTASSQAASLAQNQPTVVTPGGGPPPVVDETGTTSSSGSSSGGTTGGTTGGGTTGGTTSAALSYLILTDSGDHLHFSLAAAVSFFVLFRNGELVDPADYTLAGTALVLNRPLETGENINAVGA